MHCRSHCKKLQHVDLEQVKKYKEQWIMEIQRDRNRETLVFDITYIFGEKSTNKYISVLEASEEKLVDAAVHELINNCGEVLICTQNEVKTEEKLRGHGYRSGVDYFFFSDLKYGFINMQKKSEKAEQDYLWNIYCKIIYSPHCRYEQWHIGEHMALCKSQTASFIHA